MPRAGTGSGGGSSGGGFTNTWGDNGGFAAPPSGGSGPETQQIGTANLDVTTPAGFAKSLGTGVSEGSDLIANLGKFLFGEKGGILGGVPVVGAAGRLLGSNPVSQFAYAAPGHIADAVGGALEHIEPPAANEANQALARQFQQAPDSPAKQKALADIAADPGRTAHVQYQYLTELEQQQPDLFPEFHVAGGSLADGVTKLMGVLGGPVRLVERGFSGLSQKAGGDRLEQIDAIAHGGVPTGFLGTGFVAGPKHLSVVEQIAYSQWKDAVWTKEQALDFLSSHGSGFSRSADLEIAANVGLDPTVLGSVGAAGLAKLGMTGRLLAATKDAVALREAGTAGRFNVLGKAAESPRANAFLRWYGGHVYAPLEGSSVGKAAKIARTIIDPLHAVGQNRVTSEAVVDLQSEATTRAVFDAYGQGNSLKTLRWAHDISPELYEQISHDMGVYAANTGRRLAATYQQRTALLQGLGDQLVASIPEDFLGASKGVPAKDFAQLVKDEAARVRVTIWDDAAKQNLGERMASMYGQKSAEEYALDFAKMSDDQLGFLHAATYGAATRRFLDAVARSVPEYAGKVPLRRLVLLNTDTLTDLGAHGILDRLAAETADDVKAQLIREAQVQYPNLGYVTIRDGVEQARSIDRFQTWLASRLEKGVLPSQVTDRELAKFPLPLRQFYDDAHGAWSLGFRPEDDLLWGLERDLEGEHYAAVQAWADHVADGILPYRPASAPLLNIAGQPLIGGLARAAAVPLDYIEAGLRTLKGGITSASVTENARGRFLKIAQLRHGMTDAEAREVFGKIIDRAGLTKSTARALSQSDMWEATRHLVPSRLLDTGKMTPRDLMVNLVEAYEGDLRFVGLTQKFTGRVKTLMAKHTGVNFMGQVSEGLYPTIRFRLNAIFQLQEKLEPVILNAQRGVTFAMGTKLTAADRITQAILDKMASTGIVRMSDIDQQELSALSLVGRDIEHGLAGIAEPSRWEQLTNVQGTKRLNMLRTFQARLGSVVRESMDAHQPGLFDEIKAQMQSQSKYLLSDDEVGLRYVAEQALGNDVHVNALVTPGARAADFDAAISTQEWHTPSHLGELRPLNLDFLAKRLAIPVEGGTLDDIKSLRAALASKATTWDRVEEAMVAHNAHPDYIERVHNALDFHWDPFWSAVKGKYGLSLSESQSLQTMMSRAAKARGMTPVEFMSQVFSPYIEGGSAATINELGKAVNILRAPAKSKGTPALLMQQLSDVFAAHLDPSGRQMLLDAFQKDLPGEINDLMVAGKTGASQALQGTLESLRGGWTPETNRAFARHVLDRLNGVQGPVGADVERAVQQFGKWSREVMSDGLLAGKSGAYSDLLEKAAGLGGADAVPFNKTQQLMMGQITHAMRLKEEDAFRLHYFARTRSFFQRSINHPFFGIYPASYMWGKIAPELIRFVAKEPFGLRTGAAAYAFSDVQKSMAIQREWDHDFDALVEKLGHNQAVWFLGYLMPSLPWDVGAAAPQWMRDLAQQAAENQHRVDKGQKPLPIDFGRTIGKVSDSVSPFRQFNQVNNALKGIGELTQPTKPTPTTPTPYAPHGPLAAINLGSVLSEEYGPLQQILAKEAGG